VQKSLILAAILSLLAGSAYAACPANPADCPATAASVVTTPNLQATGLVHMSGLSSGTQTSCLGLNSSLNVVTAACGSGGGGGTPGGSNGQVQVNAAGTFGGLTNTQLTADINPFSSSLSGAVPASGGGTTKYLRADATWVVPPGGGGVSWDLSDGTTSLTGVTALTVPGSSLKVGGTAGAATLTPYLTDTLHPSSGATSNKGGQDDYNGSSITATLATLAAGQSLFVTDQHTSALTVALGGQTVVGLPLPTTLHYGGFYGFSYNSGGTLSGFGFPGFGTITTNAIGKFADGSGAMTASGLTDDGTTLSTARAVTLTGIPAGTIAAGKNLGLNSSNQLVTATVAGGGGTGCVPSGGSANQVLLDNGAGGCSDVSGTGTAGQVLTSTGAGTAPTWQAGGGGGGVTCDTGFTATFGQCVWKQTASGSASLAWTGLIRESYSLKCSLFPVSTTSTIGVQLGEGAGPTWHTGSNYTNLGIYTTLPSPGAVNNTSSTATSWTILYQTLNSGLLPALATVEFYDLTSTTVNKHISWSSMTHQTNALIQTTVGWDTTNTAAITAIRVLDTAGGNLASGSCTLRQNG